MENLWTFRTYSVNFEVVGVYLLEKYNLKDLQRSRLSKSTGHEIRKRTKKTFFIDQKPTLYSCFVAFAIIVSCF